MLIIAPSAVCLLFIAESARGVLFSTTAILVGIFPLLSVIAWRKQSRVWAKLAVASASVMLILLTWLLMVTPQGQTDPQASFRTIYPSGDPAFSRFSMGNLLPESDQLLFIFSIAPMVDPLFTAKQASELKRLTAPIYSELEDNEQFRALGSVMSESYREVIGIPRHRHVYVYIPDSKRSDKPVPVLVFFHGSGGNFKAYSWILSKLADQAGFIVVAPTNGLGNWSRESSEQGMADALLAASRVATVDSGQIHIMGVSNGGLAVSQLAASGKSQIASMILLSPVLDSMEISSVAFARHNLNRRVLIVTGERDDRIPIKYVEESMARMENASLRVTLIKYTDADHFLMFSHRVQLMKTLDEWFQVGQQSSPATGP